MSVTPGRMDFTFSEKTHRGRSGTQGSPVPDSGRRDEGTVTHIRWVFYPLVFTNTYLSTYLGDGRTERYQEVLWTEVVSVSEERQR